MSFNICVVGCGNWSRSQHGPSYARYAATHPDTELVACCDIDEERAIKYRDQFGFARHCTDYVAMLDQEKPDAVCLLMRGGEATCELSCRILEMGYPLITEKPPGDTTEQIDAMIAAAEASGAPNQVAFNRRYMGLMCELKRLVEGLAPSDIQHVRYDLIRVGRTDPNFSTTAIHAIDAARHIVGSDYAQMRFHYRELPEHGPGVANVFLDCTFDSSATGQVNICPVTGVVVERGTVYAHDNAFLLHVSHTRTGLDFPGRLQHFEKGELKLEITGSEAAGGPEEFVVNGVYAENESFFEDVRNGRRPEYDLKTARQSVAVAQCVRERRTEYQAP